jgi:hypothetical protein
MIALQYTQQGGNGWYAIWRWAIKPAARWFVGLDLQERGGPSWSDPRDT